MAGAVAGGTAGCTGGALAGGYIGSLIDDLLNSPMRDEEGENCPPAKDIVLDKKNPRKDKVGDGLSVDDAADLVKNGGDIIAKDKSTAQEIADKVGNGHPIHDKGHIPRGADNKGRPHYHPNSGNGTDGRGGGFGHIFY